MKFLGYAATIFINVR